MDKLEVARRQLGTAFHLYLQHQDPISVHVLANAGWTIAEGLARNQASYDPLIPTKGIDKTDGTEFSEDEVRAIRNKFYNAFKHYKTQRGIPRSDDDQIFNQFNEQLNDIYLFAAWFEYTQAGGKLPFEIQVFQLWFIGSNPDVIDISKYTNFLTAIKQFFPTLSSTMSYREKKNLLVTKCKSQKLKKRYETSPKTDPRSLILS